MFKRKEEVKKEMERINTKKILSVGMLLATITILPTTVFASETDTSKTMIDSSINNIVEEKEILDFNVRNDEVTSFKVLKNKIKNNKQIDEENDRIEQEKLQKLEKEKVEKEKIEIKQKLSKLNNLPKTGEFTKKIENAKTVEELTNIIKEATEKNKSLEVSKQNNTQKVSNVVKIEENENQVVNHSGIQFGSNGLLIERKSQKAQQVINLLLSIPGHRNGKSFHQQTGLDNLIDSLTTEEAIWVIHRIEGRGFGQTSAGYAGQDTPQSHQAFIRQQVNRRFGGSVHTLLKYWGTYSYGGY